MLKGNATLDILADDDASREMFERYQMLGGSMVSANGMYNLYCWLAP